jgi:RNA polymerase sigma-B factor
VTARSDAGGREATRAASHDLFAQLVSLPADDPRRAQVRADLVELHAGLAHSIARRHSRGGQHDDDLAQVALLGLVKAVDRFEPGRGVEFSSFATPTIRGEVRRHFRDNAWAAHVPRGLRELATRLPAAVDALTATLGRAPRPSEIAAELGVDPERVTEALEAAEAYSTVPLDSPVADGRPMAETLGGLDDALERIDERQALRPLIAALPPRERTIVMLRFFEERSQSEIAEAVGVSQMHVSRLLSRTLAHLREQLDSTMAV